MSLTSWTATDKFDYTELASNWNKIDAHDHTGTKGKQIPTAGIQTGAITNALIANSTITSDKLSFDTVPNQRSNYDLPKDTNYSTGTITLASTGVVTGAGGATFDSSMVGGILTVTATSKTYLITGYTSATSITVSNANADSAAAGSNYSIAYTLNDKALVLQSSYADAISSIAISGATFGSGLVTYATATHGLVTGQYVTITVASGDTNHQQANVGPITVTSITAFTIPTSAFTSTPTATMTGTITNARTLGWNELRYVSSQSQWAFIGGSPLTVKDSTNASSVLGTHYASIGSITFPYKGTYDFSVSAKVNTGAAIATSIASIAVSSGGKTAYTTSTGHNLTPGQSVTLVNCTTAANNGSFVVSDIGTTYSTGTLALAANGTVTGTGTTFASTHVGGKLLVGGYLFTITGYTSATSITVSNTDGVVVSAGAIYVIYFGTQLATGTITLAADGTLTHSGTSFTAAMVGGNVIIAGSIYQITDYTSSSVLTVANPAGKTAAAGTSYLLMYFTIFSTVNSAGVIQAGAAGSALYTANNVVYLQAGPSTSVPTTDNLAAALSSKDGNTSIISNVAQSRIINITTAGTTYNLYVRANNIAGTPTLKNWSMTATPITVLT